MKFCSYHLLCIIITFCACGNSSTDQVSGSQVPIMEYRKPQSNEEIVVGKLADLKQVSDSIYTLQIEDSLTGHLFSFEANFQDLGKTEKQIKKYLGEKVKAYYIVNTTPVIADIHFKRKTVLGSSAPLPSDEWNEISGTLNGVDSLSLNNEPRNFTIINNEGDTMPFSYVISQDILSLNNQTVTIFYENSSFNTLTYIR